MLVAVYRDVADFAFTVENLLDTIAVVDIQIEDEHSIDDAIASSSRAIAAVGSAATAPKVVQGIAGCDCDIV